MISPEEMAKICLGDKLVKTEDDKALFFKGAAVVVFDGLIIWRGDLNMKVAQDRLRLLSKALGLPVAVIEKAELEPLKKKKRKPGKTIGPNFWNENRSWDSETGLDPSFWAVYAKDCTKVKYEEKATEKAKEDWDDWCDIQDGYGCGYRGGRCY